MANLFNSIRVRPPKMNRFNLSHSVKMTAKFGVLTPFMCLDVLPGDVFKDSTEVLARFAPMVAPIMHRVNLYTHFFFVPKRLLWSEWKDFITGGEDGTASPSYPRFQMDRTTGNEFRSGSLADYLGFPVTQGSGRIHPDIKFPIDALPFRAYHLICNEYYRDQNLMDEVDIQKDSSGVMSMGSSGQADRFNYQLLHLRKRCWKKDYFTSALPWAQRGDEVELPLNGTADLLYSGNNSRVQISPLTHIVAGQTTLPSDQTLIKPLQGNINASGIPDAGQLQAFTSGATGSNTSGQIVSNEAGAYRSPYAHLTAKSLQDVISGVDLSHVSSATINELRRAIKAQEFLEVAARGGSRYIEQIYSYFGVRSSDARLQRPEFLGGGKSPVIISDVLQTSQTTETSAQATPSGHAVSVQKTHSFKYRAEEHGYIIGIMSIMPMPAYQQGLPRMFSKFDRLDHYWPQFAHLGEQEIKEKELYLNLSSPNALETSENTFGYTPRYAEYKFMQDSVHGDFRDSLDFWHMGRIFDSPPALNEAFLTNVEDAANRVFNVQDENVDKIWINIQNNLSALRKMPKFGTPLF